VVFYILENTNSFRETSEFQWTKYNGSLNKLAYIFQRIHNLELEFCFLNNVLETVTCKLLSLTTKMGQVEGEKIEERIRRE
jgi:hypothetical protein